jgi:hypothetical protein
MYDQVDETTTYILAESELGYGTAEVSPVFLSRNLQVSAYTAVVKVDHGSQQIC